MSSVLVTLADKNYLEQAKQLFSSSYHKGLWRGDFLLLAYEIPENTPELSWFRQKNIIVKHCANFLETPGGIYSHPSFFAKFYLFKPFFKQWQNVVYLDGDILVRKPITELAKARGFFASIDMSPSNLSHQFTYPQFEPQTWNEQKHLLFIELVSRFDLKEISFNAGVLVFSSDVIEKNTFEMLQPLTLRYSEINKYGDQAILNLYFYRRYNLLASRYNHFVPGAFSMENITNDIDATILHFAGFAVKPWRKESPFYEEWSENLKRADEIIMDPETKTE